MGRLLQWHRFSKWSMVLTICLCHLFVQAQQPLASSGYHDHSGQPAQEEQQRTLREILSELEEKFTVRFFYDSETLQDIKLTEEGVESLQTLEPFLKKLLDPLDLQYEKIGEKAYVIQKATLKDIKKIESIKLNMPVQEKVRQDFNSSKMRSQSTGKEPMAPQIMVRGQVTSQEDGGGLPGVNVLVKNTELGTITDIDGHYAIQVPQENDTLIFSYVGFAVVEVPVNGRAQINTSLVPDIQSLEEVVVVGYGEQKKAHVTGSIVTLDAEEIENIPFSNLAASLAGRMPGVSVSGGTARPGSTASIVIRNPISYSKDGGTTGPLYVIDNVVRDDTDFNNLDPSEVESVSILKDASAAIYGARAGQGVVLVKTKRGRPGAPKINYNGSYGITDAVALPDMMNGYQQAMYLNTYNLTRFEGDATRQEIYTPDELESYSTNNYNWLDMAWKPSHLTRHALNVSGGSEKATYYAGASYYTQDGNFDNIGYDKWTYRASADVSISDNLKLGFSLSGDYRQTEKYFSKINSSDEADMVALLHTPQFIPPYVNGYPVLLAPRGNEAYHFFEVQNSNNYKRTRETGLNINVDLKYDFPFIKGLSARAQYSRIFDNKFHKEFGTYIEVYNFEMLGEHNHIYGGDVISSVRIKNGDRVWINPDFQDRYQLNGYLTYERDFGQHHINAIAVVEQSEFYWEEVRSLKEGVVDGGLDFMYSAFGGTDAYGTGQEGATLSYLGRVNYSLANKYLAELAFRFDSSTKFAPANYWGFFPSLSLGWIISEEGFFANTFVDYLKIRGSVGLLGGDQAKPWMWRQRYTFRSDGAVFGGDNVRNYGIRMEAIPNPDVTWDDNTKVNVGIDARFLHNRLSATLDGFYDHGYGLLAERNADIPLIVGGTLPPENYAARDAFGYEVSLGWNDRIGTDFNYHINGFLSWSDDKVLNIDQNTGDVGTWKDVIGQSSDRGIQGLHYLGMFRTQDEVDAFLEENPDYTVYGLAPEPGMLYYKDIRGPKDENGQYTGPDGIIDDNDEDFLTKKAVNHYGFGSSIGVSWKGLRLDMVLAGSFGGQDIVEGDARKKAETDNNRPAFWTDHWSVDNTDAAYPNPFFEDSYDRVSAFWFRSSFAFRMRSFNLSYTLPQKAATKLGAEAASLYFSGTNPFNFYNPFDYKDPSGSYNVYPNLKTFSVGVNVTL